MNLPLRARLARVFAVSALVLGTLLPALPATAAEGEDQTLRVGTSQEFDSINPHLSYLVSSYEAMILNYDLLVGFGPDLEYAPTGFATEWDQSEDGATWTFTIREDMQWSDGEPADASDVAFTYNYLLASLDPAYTGPWAPDGNDADGDEAADNPLSLFGDFLVSTIELQSVEATSDTTVEMTTAFPTSLILGAYIPILPEHIWTDVTFASAATDFQSDPQPVVGTGPFQTVEWRRGEFARFERNENYWGKEPYIDTVIFQFYANQDAMGQALRNGEVDYIRDVLPEQFEDLDAEEDLVGIDGLGTGWSQIAFNTYDQDIEGGGASTKALRDPAFRDALGYAIDHDELVEQVLNGFGVPGGTNVPPFTAQFHIDPETPRTFDLAEAQRRLEAAGYVDSNGNGTREDKEGQEINLRIYFPDTDITYSKSAQFVADWWRQIGIGVASPQSFDSDTLTEILYTPEAGGTADYDIEIWGWAGSADPDFLLSIFTTDQIGVWSDSNYSNPEYDELYDRQKRAATFEERKPIVDEMQNFIYDEAPYLILYYDDELHAHRNDKFEGWINQPREGGVALFAYGVETYLNLVPVGSTASPSPAPGAPTQGPGVSPTPSGVPSPSPTAGSDNMPLILGIVGLVALLAVALVVFRRRPGRSVEEE
jgi:peptide/nickel transport system substrate-binding protein